MLCRHAPGFKLIHADGRVIWKGTVEQDHRHGSRRLREAGKVKPAGGDNERGNVLPLTPQLALQVQLVLFIRAHDDVNMRRLNIDGVVETIPKRRQEHLQVVERKINHYAVFHRAAPAPLGGIVHQLRDLFYLRLHFRGNTLFRAAPGEHVRHGRGGGAAFFGNIFQCSHSKNPL